MTLAPPPRLSHAQGLHAPICQALVQGQEISVDAWLDRVAVDMIGFAGAKANRRIIGLAKVSDIQQLPPDEHVRAATIVLRTASRWIRERASLRTVAAANAVFDEVRDEVLG